MSQQASVAPEDGVAAESLRRTVRVSLAVIALLLATLAIRIGTLIEGPADPFRYSLWMGVSVMSSGATAAALLSAALTPSRGLARMGWAWWGIAATPILWPLGALPVLVAIAAFGLP